MRFIVAATLLSLLAGAEARPGWKSIEEADRQSAQLKPMFDSNVRRLRASRAEKPRGTWVSLAAARRPRSPGAARSRLTSCAPLPAGRPEPEVCVRAVEGQLGEELPR